MDNKNVFSKIKIFIKKLEHKVLFYSSFVSFTVAAVLYILSIFCYPTAKTVQLGLFYFIPFLLTLLVYYFIGILLYQNFLTFAKIMSAVLNFLTIGVLQFFLSFVILFIIGIEYDGIIYEDIKTYNKSIETIWGKDGIKHFPLKIPADVRDAKLYKSANGFFGSECISLSFKIDKNYTDNELKKYNFIETEGPFEKDEEYSDNTERYYAVNHLNLKKAGFKFYVIGQGKGEYGIAVNDKTNRILYYSVFLD